jgi:type IV secretory pathway TraG/TraD family ATPase VirD4
LGAVVPAVRLSLLLPPAFFWWWYGYDAYAPSIFVEGAYIAASGGFISVAVAIGMSVWRAREAKKVETYGSARWAETEEVKAAGCSVPMASCSAATTATIFAMTDRSMCCASRRPVPARASAWSCPRC